MSETEPKPPVKFAGGAYFEVFMKLVFHTDLDPVLLTILARQA